MRILMITASLPYPPASGGAIRAYGLLHGLHAAGHDITLLSFHDHDESPDDTPLADFCSHIETLPPPARTKTDRLRDLLLSRQADIARRMYSDTFHGRLVTLLREESFDLVQFEGIEVACYLPLAKSTGTTARLCYDAFNAEADLQRIIFQIDRGEIKRWPAALYSWIQAGRIGRFERSICQQADGVVAVSPEDAAILRQLRADKQVYVVPNGIFADSYQAPESTVDLGDKAIVFTGKMDYRPNVDAMWWFGNDILPSITGQIPNAHLTIVGQKPHPRLAPFAERGDITLTGRVDSVAPYLHAAAVYVAPLRMGSGTRLKILEAMASGCAIVATSTAASGLLDDAKRALVITDGEQDIASAIIALLHHPAERVQRGKQAQQDVKQHYDWSVLIPRLLAVYKDMGLG